MKPKYLDKRNCHALLPTSYGLPMLQKLDDSLRQLNARSGSCYGMFDKLVSQNQRTTNKSPASSRLINFQVDIAQILYPAKGEMNTQAIENRPYPGPAQLHTVIENPNGTVWKTLVPIQYLLKGWGDANSGHQSYVHSISRNMPRRGARDQLIERQFRDEDTYYYVGITSRNWLQRLGEHDLTPKFSAMTSMRFPVNLPQGRSQYEETLHRRTNH